MSKGKGKYSNLASRIDNLRNLNESFTYDNLNRLTDIELNGVQTGMMTYDDYGRMTSKTMDGQLVFQGASFDGPEGKPHAIKSAQTNEGVFPADVQKITYTSFDKVKTIVEGEKRLSYTYGYNRQRIGMEETVGGKQRNKTYVGNCEYIKETADGVTTEKVLTYLSGPTGVFAVVEKQGEEESLHYILKDHLGSWTTITDAEGNVEQELSFDAWGNLRDADTWTGSSTEAPMFDRGYTGHEHITAFGLISMNGRCYDPTMSSFLSVDEYVQDPTSAQNFNRYAYCLNNPLKYTDPSGWMYLGASHSQECEFNQYRRYMNAHLTEEQWANSGINRAILAYVKMGVGYIMTPFMMGEEQKGGGAGSSFSANMVYNSDGSCKVSVTYYGSDGPTFQSFEYSKEEMLTFGNSDPAYVASVVGEGACLFMSLGEICHRLGDDISNAEYWKEKEFLYFLDNGRRFHGYKSACIADFIQWNPDNLFTEYKASCINYDGGGEIQIPSLYDSNSQFLIAVALKEDHARLNNVDKGHAVVLNSYNQPDKNSDYYEMCIGDPSPQRLVQSSFYHRRNTNSLPSGVEQWWFIKIWRP